MATVYDVVGDIDNYQRLESEGWDHSRIRRPFRGSKAIDATLWASPKVRVPKPRLPEPDIWSVAIGGTPTIAFGKRALDLLRPILESVGQLLPLKHRRKELAVLNVTYVVDCIDDERAVRDPELPSMIDEYAFDVSRLKHSIFKIPEHDFVLRTVEGIFDLEHDFKRLVEQQNFTGLWFRKLWSAEGVHRKKQNAPPNGAKPSKAAKRPKRQ